MKVVVVDTGYVGAPSPRCFLHVADAVEAIIALAGSPGAVGEVYKVGSTEEISILELARRVLKLVAAPPPAAGDEPITFVPYEEAYAAVGGGGFEDMQRRVPDTAKMRALTGWAPRRSLDDALKAIIGVSESTLCRTS